jgi:hypothetical protein
MIFMKRGILFLVVLLTICLSGCEEHKPTEAKDFNNNLKDFNKSLHHVDKTMDIIDQMDAEMKKVTDLEKSGAITNEEAERRMDIIRNKYAQKLVKSSGVTKESRFPEWAKRIGLKAPENMKLDLSVSQITSVNDKATGYNSLNFVYKGNYDVAMKQAALIAKNAGVPVGKDYQEALDLANELNIEPVKGAVYMNFEIGKQDAQQYHIAITVDETGTLTITATDVDQFSRQLEENTK